MNQKKKMYVLVEKWRLELTYLQKKNTHGKLKKKITQFSFLTFMSSLEKHQI